MPKPVVLMTEDDLRRILREELRYEFFRQLSEQDPEDLPNPELDSEC